LFCYGFGYTWLLYTMSCYSTSQMHTYVHAHTFIHTYIHIQAYISIYT